MDVIHLLKTLQESKIMLDCLLDRQTRILLHFQKQKLLQDELSSPPDTDSEDDKKIDLYLKKCNDSKTRLWFPKRVNFLIDNLMTKPKLKLIERRLLMGVLQHKEKRLQAMLDGKNELAASFRILMDGITQAKQVVQEKSRK